MNSFIQVVPRLSADDKLHRVQCSEAILGVFNREGFDSSLMFFSDEANFYRDGTVTVHNAVIWGTQRPPNHFKEKSLASPKVVVWSAISSEFLIGPYILDEGTKCQWTCLSY